MNVWAELPLNVPVADQIYSVDNDQRLKNVVHTTMIFFPSWSESCTISDPLPWCNIPDSEIRYKLLLGHQPNKAYLQVSTPHIKDNMTIYGITIADCAQVLYHSNPCSHAEVVDGREQCEEDVSKYTQLECGNRSRFLCYVHIVFAVTPELLSDRWDKNPHMESIVDSRKQCEIALNHLRYNSRESDMLILRAGNMPPLHMHSILLVSRSPTVKNIVRHLERSGLLPYILDLSMYRPDAVENFVDYVYNGFLPHHALDNCDLIKLFRDILPVGIVSVAFNRMITRHEGIISQLQLTYDKSVCGTDRSLMTMLTNLPRHIPPDIYVDIHGGVNLIGHKDILLAFSPAFQVIKDIPRFSNVVMDYHPITMIMSLWDFMYCSIQCYDQEWREKIIPKLVSSGLLRS